MEAVATNGRVIVLCERLVEATRAGDVEWSREGADTYEWQDADGAVSIGARDHDGQPPYDLAVFNNDREKVEELTSALVDDDRPAAWNESLAELYTVARRSALHADDIIESLIAALPQR